MTAYADEMAMPEVAAVALLMFQHAHDPRVAATVTRFRSATTDRGRAALDLATMHGEVELTVSRDAAALLIGPILYHTWVQIDIVPADLINRLIDSIGTWK